MTKPVWLMDVDGVINDWRPPLAEGWVRFPTAHGFEMTFDPTLLERIVSLHTSGAVEVKWLTTWCHDANEMLRENFGFPEDLYVLGYDHYVDTRIAMRFPNGSKNWFKYHWWKLRTVDDFVSEFPDKRIIWTDDEIEETPQAVEYIINNDNIFAVSPDPYLTHDEVDSIEEWIKK